MITLILLAQVAVKPPVAIFRPYPVSGNVIARAHRLWNPADGAQLAVVPFSLVLQLRGRRDSIDYEVELRPGDNRRPDRKSPAHVELWARGGTWQTLGVLAGPIPNEAEFWRVVARDRKRSTENVASVRLARLGEEAFSLSDLIVGAPGQGVQWVLGADTVSLAPNEVVPATETIQLFYQMRSTKPLNGVRTRLTLTRVVGNESQEDQVLSFTYPAEDVRSGLTSVQRDVDVSRFSGSRYRIDIVVTNAAGTLLGANKSMLELVR